MDENEILTETSVAAETPVQDSAPAPEGKKGLKLDYKKTFKVGLAFAGITMFWTAYDFVVPLLIENVYGLPNWLRGLILGLDNLLSLFMLPLFGKLSDNAHGKLVKKFGRRTPFIVIGTICAVALMVFVPVSTLKQQNVANERIAYYETMFDQDASFRETEFGKWYDQAVAGNEKDAFEVDLEYLNNNGITRDEFVKLNFDENMVSKKAILNMLGEESYFYGEKQIYPLPDEKKGETRNPELTYLDDVEPVSGKTYQEILDGNSDYKKYVATSINSYISHQVYVQDTQTKDGVKSLAVYMVILLLVLVSMATFRSPAVALMPDVTPKPLRSQANAIINLCGGLGGAVSFLIYTVVLFGENVNNYVIIFGAVGAGMLLLLAGFLSFVKERKLVAECQEICKEYGIDDFDEEESAETKAKAEALLEASESEDGEVHGAVVQDETSVEEKTEISPEVLELAKAKTAKTKSPKEWWSSKDDLEKKRLKSFVLILASIFMWFMGYNAVSSNLSVYTTKALNLSAGTASIISGISMAISAIAFIPVGYLAVKIGRRKSIMLGFALATVSFVLVCFAVKPGDSILPAVLFILFYLLAGFGLIIANVNTFPMVTELSTAETVGQYTGYYYVATMSAQAITPMIGGAVMDAGQDKYLFLYSAICIIVAIVLMLFVKHGDSKQIPGEKKKKLTKEEKRQIRLDTLEQMD